MNPVLILTHNCLELTKKCVESVLTQDVDTEFFCGITACPTDRPTEVDENRHPQRLRRGPLNHPCQRHLGALLSEQPRRQPWMELGPRLFLR